MSRLGSPDRCRTAAGSASRRTRATSAELANLAVPWIRSMTQNHDPILIVFGRPLLPRLARGRTQRGRPPVRLMGLAPGRILEDC